MKLANNSENEKDKTLRKDFKVAQYIYVALYTALVISLIIISI